MLIQGDIHVENLEKSKALIKGYTEFRCFEDRSHDRKYTATCCMAYLTKSFTMGSGFKDCFLGGRFQSNIDHHIFQ